MDKPKFSEVLRAAAKGATAPFYRAGVSFQISDRAAAESRAEAFIAIAELYELYERQAEASNSSEKRPENGQG